MACLSNLFLILSVMVMFVTLPCTKASSLPQLSTTERAEAMSVRIRGTIKRQMIDMIDEITKNRADLADDVTRIDKEGVDRMEKEWMEIIRSYCNPSDPSPGEPEIPGATNPCWGGRGRRTKPCTPMDPSERTYSNGPVYYWSESLPCNTLSGSCKLLPERFPVSLDMQRMSAFTFP